MEVGAAGSTVWNNFGPIQPPFCAKPNPLNSPFLRQKNANVIAYLPQAQPNKHTLCRTNGITQETAAAAKKGDTYRNQIRGFFKTPGQKPGSQAEWWSGW
eukprot:364054-Chlamydomonas_euryale.AAC.8